MKTIKIKDSELKIDSCDYHLIEGKNLVLSGHRSGNTEYVRVLKNSTYTYLHRIITGAKDGESVDHINGDGLDNRRSNLRICTHRQNMMNRKMPKRKYPRGVFKKKDKKKLLAQITVKGKSINLGYYLCPALASLAYQEARDKYFGDFAKISVKTECKPSQLMQN